MMQLREHFREYLREAGLLYDDHSDLNRDDKEVGDDDTTATAADDDLLSSRHVKVRTTYDESAIVDNGSGIASSIARRDEVNWNIVLGVICAGLFPQVVRLGRFKEKARGKGSSSSSSSSRHHHRSNAGGGGGVQESIKLLQHDLQDVALHPSSLLAGYVRDILEHQQQQQQQQQPMKKKEEEAKPAADAFLVYYKKVIINLCSS